MIGLGIALAYHLDPKPNNVRRIVGLCTEFGAGIYFSSIGGASVAAFYPIYLWVILGYGFRYGVKWLFIAATMGTLSFGWTVYNIPFWYENKSLSIGLLAGLFIIPAYCSTLILKLSKAKEEAESANKAKSLFLANISHELRTPLNAIIGYGTHMLEMGLPEKQNQMVATSVSAGRHLLHLINQLLSFSHSESRDELPEPKEFSAINLLSEVRDIMQINADEKDLEIHLQAETMSDRLIAGQLDHIRNILINLTSNAVKFTCKGSILLKCGIHKNSGSHLLWCSVTDTGPGIAEEAQNKIFEVFQQANDGVQADFGGTGLGLAICRKLAIQMGGDVIVESQVGMGSTFTLTCPVAIAESNNDGPDENSFRLLSLGSKPLGPEIQSDNIDTIHVEHIELHSKDDICAILKNKNLSNFHLAVLDQNAAEMCEENSATWPLFQAAKLAPVLLSQSQSANLDDIRLRAAFASVLPASPDFDEIRSVIQIGCSFNHVKVLEIETESNPDKNGPPLRILVADDNRTNQMVLDTILSNAGHNVVTVGDGNQVLEKLEADAFDLVFLDVNMPSLGGIECCKLWRQIEGPRNHIPIIGLTADSTEETEKKCLNAGMDLRITKPVETGSLLKVIAQHTNHLRSGNSGNNFVDRPVSDPFNVVQSIDGTYDVDAISPIDETQMEYLASIGDSDFVQSIVQSYLEDNIAILSAFKSSVEQENIAEFRFQAHAFKSGANNVGALGLSEICSKLEVITQPDFDSRRHEYLSLVETELSAITQYLEAQRSPSQDEAKKFSSASVNFSQ
ncbi:response regulator [Parasphingorhabdus halotolerans]|uniref:histidine kinase n=1 Tax=Parasphingorhabdus halotolerans TaxID=2725558 RepID=A0A6H2DJ89_9SPHN|nr:response regulator [Parasphingorhabdus halotolerans]